MNTICKTCNHELSAVLSPFESFKAQLKRLFAGFCSKRCARASFKISSSLLLLALGFGFVGCKSLSRLPGLESPHSTPNADVQNPNDFYVTGTTTKDHQSVYMVIKNRTITVEVLKPGETAWITLERPDLNDYLDSYQLFTIPQEGVYFGKFAYKNTTGGNVFTSEPSAPTGTQYRIHTVAKP